MSYLLNKAECDSVCFLTETALFMRSRSHSPYSGFAVGAALLAADGTVYTGCNIENASFTPTICAERTALFKAISEGAREFTAIAITGGKAGAEPTDFCPPCGVCRQVLSEFCKGDLKVYLVKSPDEVLALTLDELMPFTFTLLDP